MNGDARKFGIAAGVILAAAGLCACVSDPSIKTSPIAAQVAAAVAAPARKPTFAGVPATPTDLRDPKAWREAVGDEEVMRDRVLAESAADTFALKGDTDAFAVRSRAEATRDAPTAATAGDRAATEAYAASLRGQASAPPATPR